MIKDDKGLPGVRGPKPGQTMEGSMTEQIFELQEENETWKVRLIRYLLLSNN